jgi:D-serine deaminase-like pyridoxal phosphate-dependent protein
MDPRYQIEDTREIITPALIVFRDLVLENIAGMMAIAGGPKRLRPHCKTHKTREVTRLLLERGITRHKCATFAEAEMLAEAGASDILLAYHIVGPNIGRAVRFVERYPHVDYSVLADDELPIGALSRAMSAARRSIGVLLDVDTGQHRTGVTAGERAGNLYEQIAKSPGLQAAGFHMYDGHQHQQSRDERRAAIDVEWRRVVALRDSLEKRGFAVPRIVAGGTGSFPVYAEKSDPAIELSPGTCVFHDAGYIAKFPDLAFTPAALLLTRVISRPTKDRLTLDLGYKAAASDPPAGSRLVFPDLPEAKQVLQNEEHLVLETDRASEFHPGDELLAIPYHICPTTAMHKEILVVAGGKLVDRWQVASRDRFLTI